ncbi:hypothetical protein ACOMHN_061595 [Nucella lapillus]
MIHVDYFTPGPAIVVSMAWSLAVLFSSSLTSMMDYISLCSTLIAIAVILCVFYLRYTEPNRPRPYKTMWIVPSVEFVINVIVLIMTVYRKPDSMGFGLGVFFAGIPIYWVAIVWKSKPTGYNEFVARFDQYQSLQNCPNPESVRPLSYGRSEVETSEGSSERPDFKGELAESDGSYTGPMTRQLSRVAAEEKSRTVPGTESPTERLKKARAIRDRGMVKMLQERERSMVEIMGAREREKRELRRRERKEEREWLEEKERREQERLEEKERREQERLEEKERREQERVRKERLEDQERLEEKERREQERVRKERLEDQERLEEKERSEQERVRKERLEDQERLEEKERREQERVRKERLEDQERLEEKERREQERVRKERLEDQERLEEKERREQERVRKERLEDQERLEEKERREQERVRKERLEDQERLEEKERREQERLEEMERRREERLEERELVKEERLRKEREEELSYRERMLAAHEAANVPLEPLNEKEDVDAYITQFERIATMNGRNRAGWASKLVSLVRGRPRDALMRLSPEEMREYDVVRKALMNYFRLGEETYRRKFRAMRKEPEETFEQLLGRLITCLTRWCGAAGKDENDAEEIKDLFLREQLYEMITPDLRMEVRRASPKTAEAIAEEATKLARVRQTNREAGGISGRSYVSQVPKGKPAEPISLVPMLGSRPAQVHGDNHQSRRNTVNPRAMATCFNCHQAGHFIKDCPRRQRMATIMTDQHETHVETVPLCGPYAARPYNPRAVVVVNGISVVGLRDTGASQTVVAKRLVHEGAYTGETTAIALADAARRTELPVAIVEIQSPFIQGRMKVLVMEEPIVDVLIGNYCRRANGTVTEVPVYPVSQVAAVTTRAQANKGTQGSPPLKIAGIEIGVTPEELGVLQREDPSLRKGRETCEQGTTHTTRNGTVSYFRKGEVMMRRFEKDGIVSSQIVVPDGLRTPVMTLAHDAPMSGHLAAQRTLQRVFRHFYWPGMCADIRRFCASCVQCQKTIAKGRVPKVPLVRMPTVKEPFQKVGVDIIGPMIPRAASGNRYVLVMVDFATRYPEAVPLKGIDAESVAAALFNM